jgi:hypothetical protein
MLPKGNGRPPCSAVPARDRQVVCSSQATLPSAITSISPNSRNKSGSVNMLLFGDVSISGITKMTKFRPTN